MFLYTNKPAEREIKKISFTIATKRIKYLGINLTKEVKTVTENHKTLFQETEEDTKK